MTECVLMWCVCHTTCAETTLVVSCTRRCSARRLHTWQAWLLSRRCLPRRGSEDPQKYVIYMPAKTSLGSMLLTVIQPRASNAMFRLINNFLLHKLPHLSTHYSVSQNAYFPLSICIKINRYEILGSLWYLLWLDCIATVNIYEMLWGHYDISYGWTV